MADKRKESEPIDRDKLKQPEEVSGWRSEGEGGTQNLFADIAKDSPVNPEGDPDRAEMTGIPRAKGDESGFGGTETPAADKTLKFD